MKRTAALIGVFILLLAAYLWTIAPGSFWLDSAAFATCNEILGLPHSPSFPVYTVLGRLIHVITPTDPARASNLYSALAAALSGVVCYLVLVHLFGGAVENRRMAQAFALAGALYACLTTPVWQSAVRAEIYALQILLSLLIVYLFLKTIESPAPRRQIACGTAMLFVQGLAFANHSLLALATAPLIPVAAWKVGHNRAGKDMISVLAIGAAVFSLALSFYLYLPIRSNQNPAVNSGRPTTLSATIQAVSRTGEEYLPAVPASTSGYPIRAANLGQFIVNQAGGVVLLGLVAALYLAVRERKWTLPILLVPVIVGIGITLWSADFDLLNFDIVAYSALPLMLLIVFGMYGLFRVFHRFKDRRRIDYTAYALCGILVFFQFSGNLYSSDFSGTKGPDRLAASILEEAPQDAILLVNEDNVLLPLWYHCFALKKRPDVAVISAGGLFRPSYREEVRRVYPDLSFPPEFAHYRIEDLGAALQSFRLLNEDRPLLVQFGSPGIEPERLSPAGFLFRYSPGGPVSDAGDRKRLLALLDTISAGATDLQTKDFVARTAFNYGVYFDRVGDRKAAFTFFRYAIETDDANPAYLLRLGVAFLKAGKVEQAVMLLEQAAITGKGCPEAEEILRQLREREYGRR